MKLFLFSLFFSGSLFAHSDRALDQLSVEELKERIVKTASLYTGLGDPTFSIQNELTPLVDKLLKLNPQKPLKERIDTIAGRWRQVWGPYDYRDTQKRGVDKTLDPTKIYQVVFRDGYYYNVSNNIDPKTGKTKSTGLLRGVFKVKEDVLKVRFTNLRRIRSTPPNGLKYTDLPELSEARTLENEKTVLPSFIVKLFFGRGALREVYTDQDLRIAYGTDQKGAKHRNGRKGEFLYILERVE